MAKRTFKQWCVEAFGQVFLLLGAFFLVFAFYPLLNPGKAKLEGIDGWSLGYCLPLLAIAGVLFLTGWLICRYSRKFARKSQGSVQGKD